MQAVPLTNQRRTFSRANGADGTAVPRLVAAEERHRKNLQQIQQLKQALCSTVSGATAPDMSVPLSRGWALPSSTLSVPPPSGSSWMASSFESPSGVVASPSQRSWATAAASHQLTWTPASATALYESQQEVERLVKERNKLQRQCVEWASLLSEASRGASGSVCTEGPLASHSAGETGARSPLHEAALAVVRQVARCYPNVVRETKIKSGFVTEDAITPQCARSSASSASHESELNAARLQGSGSPPLTTEEMADTLHRLADFLPGLASSTSGSEIVAASEPDLLHHIQTLEEERQSDCLAVLSIADHLTEVATVLRREAAEKDEALRAMQEMVEGLMEEKAQWARRARASEEALEERYELYSRREKAWEREVRGLLQPGQNAEAASAAPMVFPAPIAVAVEDDVGAVSATEVREVHISQLQQELDIKEDALANLQEDYRGLQATHAELQARSQQAEAAHHKRIAALESQLHPLEAELQTQACIIESTLRKLEELSSAHRAETTALTESHSAMLAGKEVALLSLQEAKERVEVELAECSADAAQMRAELKAAAGKLAAALSASDGPRSLCLRCDGVSVESPSAEESTSPLRFAGLREDGGDEVDGDGANASLQMDSSSTARNQERADNGDVGNAAESPTKHVDVRKLQQSLKRMGRERVTLKRKLEHRGNALAEMESELEAAQRLVAQRDAQVQALAAELETAKATAASALADAKAADEDNAATEETDAVAPFPLMDFVELERYEDEGTLYPVPVDLSEWLLGHTEGSSVRFSTYVQRQLSENEKLRIAAVGPLYHIGFTLLKIEGFLTHEEDPLCLPLTWRRCLFQLQHVLDAQLQTTVLSPADSAKCFYALASTAGLFGNRADLRPDPLTVYSLIIAALCVCLRSPAASSSTDSSFKWQCCQAILRHVSHYGDSNATSQTGRTIEGADTQAPDDMFRALCTELSATTALPEEDAGDSGATVSDGTASVPVPCSIRLATLLASGLLSDHLPISHFALCAAALSDIVESKAALNRLRLTASLPTEATQLFAAARPRGSLTQEHDVAQLLMYVARHEYLLSGWAQEMDDAIANGRGDVTSRYGHRGHITFLTLSSLGISATWPALVSVHKASSSSAAVSSGASSPTEVESITQLLLFLCTGLLPALILAAHRCPSLEQESQLINAFFRTRRLLMEKRTALLARSLTEASASSDVVAGVSLLLPEAQLRSLVNAALAPLTHTASFPQRAVQVPVSEYEQLHRELLTLYETNDTYHQYIQELLSAAEAA
ncbi:hypothetical protein JIQ42_02631 [Leishmania sp. Namibia]|uniref:hypothetical protein n=1 Tax=Leishmania sp. Namibia TaxID=2802991 RepID=UPI001B42AAC0|nr:hypothetical protein JIQ42_02631 [Leishmania sp. Namibia]